MNKKLCRIFLIFIVYAFVICSSVAWAYEISIVGSPEYREQVKQALTLLRDKAPDKYKIVKDYVGRIEQNLRSGMDVYQNPPTYQMSDRTAYHSFTWCASTIAHDAYHSKLYHDYKDKNGEPVPYEVWGGFEAERKCIKIQAETLKQIGAPFNEVSYCISLDGTHGDINKDGKLDETDYQLRDW